MPNRNLTLDELAKASELLREIREHLKAMAGGDRELEFAYRRKIVKELGYDERSKPGARNKVKAIKLREQGGKCAECGEPLPQKYSVLDRKHAVDGYTPENTELIHAECDYKRQAVKGYR
jgi:hypothetical protein